MKQTIPLLRSGEQVGTADVEQRPDGTLAITAKFTDAEAVNSVTDGIECLRVAFNAVKEKQELE